MVCRPTSVSRKTCRLGLEVNPGTGDVQMRHVTLTATCLLVCSCTMGNVRTTDRSTPDSSIVTGEELLRYAPLSTTLAAGLPRVRPWLSSPRFAGLSVRVNNSAATDVSVLGSILITEVESVELRKHSTLDNPHFDPDGSIVGGGAVLLVTLRKR